ELCSEEICHSSSVSSVSMITYDNLPVTVLKSADQNTSTILPDNIPELSTNEVKEIEEIEINFKLIIKAADGKCNAAK
ncbi:2100_t:CDS:2, partial [Funneliformis caledonium]